MLSGYGSILGVGVVSWSPLACGIITGKYENGVPESSRASMRVSFVSNMVTVFSLPTLIQHVEKKIIVMIRLK